MRCASRTTVLDEVGATGGYLGPDNTDVAQKIDLRIRGFVELLSIPPCRRIPEMPLRVIFFKVRLL